jgi:2-polyprenyl-3-methyl-5-hydroxy-6-metoxy-1,4-benzoquinol methylase
MAEDFCGKYLKANFLTQRLLNIFFKTIEKTVFDLKVSEILEVACGAGFSTLSLSKIFAGKNFQASEIRPDLVEKAKLRNQKVEIKCESLYELKRPDNSFDLLLALEVLEHLENPELALRELKRVTSKYCLLSVPNEPLWQMLNVCRLKYLKDLGNTPGHINHWSKKSFIVLLSKYFKIKKVAVSLPWVIILVEK